MRYAAGRRPSAHRYVLAGIPVLLLSVLLSSCSPSVGTVSEHAREPLTYANPLDLNYRFMRNEPSRREAADPEIVPYKGEYLLFASQAGGYWRSDNLRDWTLITTEGFPTEAYAPAVLALGDTLYMTANNTPVYMTTDAFAGKWVEVSDAIQVGDPMFFKDDDGRVYLYFGVTFNGPINGVEIDPSDGFRQVGEPFVCFRGDYERRGWEQIGDDNLGVAGKDSTAYAPWIEGAYMVKHDGVYYLQYAAPGTEFKSYADGVYTAPSPRGPFSYLPSSPVSFKPTGFITGAGHSGVFKDNQGHFWRISTMVVSVKDKFERRLGLFPVGFDEDGVEYTNTYLGDYPQLLSGAAPEPGKDNLAGWMLLSYGKHATSSSTLAGHPLPNAFDEDVKTHWSASSGNPGEWLQVDLGHVATIRALQVNFAEQDTRAFRRDSSIFEQYTIEVSADGASWSMQVDESSSRRDAPHHYIPLASPVQARYIRLTNIFSPADGKFAVRDLRVFGLIPGEPPPAVNNVRAVRDSADLRRMHVTWTGVPEATGYVVRYGTAPDKLYNSYQVYGRPSVDINSLNVGVSYYLSVDGFNGSGIRKSTDVIAIE